MFTTKKKIYYHDTDCGGVVYYSNYLKYFEEARTEYFYSKGIDLSELADKLLFVVTNVDVKYKKPARYADEILILTKIEEIKTPIRINFYHQVKKGESVLVECSTTLASLNPKTFRPTSIPQEILAMLQKGVPG